MENSKHNGRLAVLKGDEAVEPFGALVQHRSTIVHQVRIGLCSVPVIVRLTTACPTVQVFSATTCGQYLTAVNHLGPRLIIVLYVLRFAAPSRQQYPMLLPDV